jgi:hypothetical protein
MTFPVLVEACEDRFTATLVGVPDVRVTAATRAEAIAALKVEIAQRVGHGELLSVEVETGGIAALAGKYASDPTLVQISDDLYQQRDAERPE